MDITSFSGEYRFLSNFWPCTVTLDGEQYPSVEHAYQAAKIPCAWEAAPQARRAIADLPTPGQAKQAGKRISIREGWESHRIFVMRELLQQKFSTDPLRSQLIATYPFHLEEGNTWGDTFWGVCKGRGQNVLGRMLMEIRDELIKGQQQ